MEIFWPNGFCFSGDMRTGGNQFETIHKIIRNQDLQIYICSINGAIMCDNLPGKAN